MTATFRKKSIEVLVTHENRTVTPDGNLVVHGPCTVVPGDGAHLGGSHISGTNLESLGAATAVELDPGEAAVFASRADLQAAPGSQWARASYWSQPGRSNIDEMLAVVCVPWPKQEEPVFRPPAIGTNLIAKFLRGTPIPVSRLRLDKLPQRIDLVALGGSVPPVDYFNRIFADFSGDIYDGWSTDTRTPDLQHPGYGTFLAGLVSQALVFLCSTESDVMKRPLAERLVQWGLDLAGAFGDGRDNSAVGGGHMASRKSLLMLAGHLLDASPLADPNSYVGKVFMEDNAFTSRGWRHSVGAEGAAGDWSEKRLWTAQTKTAMSYCSQVTGAQVGTALAMKLMGLSTQMGVDYMAWMELWMSGAIKPGHPVFDAYHINGMDVGAGQCYSVGGGAGMCAAAWRQVHQ